MAAPKVCDHSDCPAVALHHVDVRGQDFHFCNHHWVELSPQLRDHIDTWVPEGRLLDEQRSWSGTTADADRSASVV